MANSATEEQTVAVCNDSIRLRADGAVDNGVLTRVRGRSYPTVEVLEAIFAVR